MHDFRAYFDMEFGRHGHTGTRWWYDALGNGSDTQNNFIEGNWRPINRWIGYTTAGPLTVAGLLLGKVLINLTTAGQQKRRATRSNTQTAKW